MNSPTARKSRNRTPLPPDALRVCASCLTPRGKQTRDWTPILRKHVVIGWTCPDCPLYDGEPIRRVVVNGRVRYAATVDATPSGARNRRQVSKTTGSLAETRAWVAKVRADVATDGLFTPRPVESVTELAARWLTTRVDIRPGTVNAYRATLTAPLRTPFGDLSVTAVRTADVEALTGWLTTAGGRKGEGLKVSSARRVLVALSQVFDLAVAEQTITANPVKAARRPRQRSTVGAAVQHWDRQQLRAFLTVTDADPWAAAWRLTASALTRSDLLGLTWANVDLDAGTVTITQGRTVVAGVDVVDDPKTPHRRRTVNVEAIHPGTVALLRTLRASQAGARLRAGTTWHESPFVLVDGHGAPVRPAAYSHRFRRLTRQAGNPPIRLHAVRHTVAGLLHQAGVTPADAAALLGHDVQTHLSTYLPSSGTAGVESASAALGALMAVTA